MKQVSVAHAKSHLSELISAVEEGAEVMITRRNKPIARLVRADAFLRKSREPFDFERLRRHVEAMPESAVSAADLVRKMRDDAF
jgi:prevent-host-death family protein